MTLQYKMVMAMVGLLLALTTSSAHAVDNALLKELEATYVALHEGVGPCVVNIETRGAAEESDMGDLFHFFNIPEPEGQPREAPRSRATGSGFIYDKSGLIVTNNHVVENSDAITVRLWNGDEYDAEVVGTDPDTDLAVIRIEPDEDLPAAELGDSDNIRVGQFAIAIGSPRQLEGSVSFGHISALGRDGLTGLQQQGLRFQNLIQTDAAINLGNSGGPLCNIDGEVIGINTAIVWGANSIGFAIPINMAKRIVPELISDGRVTRGFLGVGIDDASGFAEALGSPDRYGAFVKEIRVGTPAEEADLRTYDIIRKVNGAAVRSASDLVTKISSYSPGSNVTLEVWRDGEAMDVEVLLAEWTAGNTAAPSREPSVLGMRVRPIAPELLERSGLPADQEGVLIAEVEANSPAEEAGLSQGDIVIEVSQQDVKSVETFRQLVEKQVESGKPLLIRYIRGGNDPDITVLKVPGDR